MLLSLLWEACCFIHAGRDPSLEAQWPALGRARSAWHFKCGSEVLHLGHKICDRGGLVTVDRDNRWSSSANAGLTSQRCFDRCCAGRTAEPYGYISALSEELKISTSSLARWTRSERCLIPPAACSHISVCLLNMIFNHKHIGQRPKSTLCLMTNTVSGHCILKHLWKPRRRR